MISLLDLKVGTCWKVDDLNCKYIYLALILKPVKNPPRFDDHEADTSVKLVTVNRFWSESIKYSYVRGFCVVSRGVTTDAALKSWSSITRNQFEAMYNLTSKCGLSDTDD